MTRLFNHGAKWNMDEMDLLSRLRVMRTPPREIALRLGRTRHAVHSAMKVLRLRAKRKAT